MSTPATRRRVAGEIQAEFECSQRRSCRALGFARSSVLYRSRRQEEPELVERLKALAAERPRFGYRRLHRLLGREGFAVNHKRVHRLYRAEGLALRRKRRKRIASAPRLVRVSPTRPNERWSMDAASAFSTSSTSSRARRWRPSSRPQSAALELPESSTCWLHIVANPRQSSATTALSSLAKPWTLGPTAPA